MLKYYEILISHKEGACPTLPNHPDLHYIEAGEYCNWTCPTHQVMQKICDVAVARDRIERLKRVKEIERIRLFYGGDVKERDQWERGTWGQWERI